MSITDSLFQFATGFSDGVAMNHQRVDELDFHQGTNALFAGVFQIGQAFYALDAIDSLIKKIATPLIFHSFNQNIQTICTYSTLAFIAYAGYARDNAKAAVTFKEKTIGFINDHAGTISQTIVIISAIAECALGNWIQGGATLFMMGVGYLDRNGYIKWEFRLLLSNKKIVPIVNCFQLFFSKSTLKKVFAAVTLALRFSPSAQKPFFWMDRQITNWYGNIYPPIEETVPNETTVPLDSNPQFTADELFAFDPKVDQLEIDFTHLQRAIKCDFNVNAKFETLNSLLDDIGFEGEAFTKLISKIENDDRFKRALAYLMTYHSHLENVSQEGKAWEAFVFEYGRSQLKALSDTLQKTEKYQEKEKELLPLANKLSFQGTSEDFKAFLLQLLRQTSLEIHPEDTLKPALFTHLESLLQTANLFIEKDESFRKFLANLIAKEPYFKMVKQEGEVWDIFALEYGKRQLKLLIKAQKNSNEQKRLLQIVHGLSYSGDSKDLEAFLQLLEQDKTMEANAEDLQPTVKPALLVVSHLESLLQTMTTTKNAEEKQNAKLDAQNLLSTLMVEGGKYCAQGIHDTIFECVGRINGQGNENIGLQASLDIVAQIIREQGFNQLYGQLFASELSLYEDRHLFRVIKDSQGLGLGLSRTTVPNILELFIAILISPFRPLFWMSNAKNIISRKIQILEDKLNEAGWDFQLDQSNWKIIQIAKKIKFYFKALPMAFSIVRLQRRQERFESNFNYNATTVIECAQSHLLNPKQRNQYVDWWQNYLSKFEDDERLEQILHNLSYKKYLTIMLIEMGFIKKP